MSSKIRINPEHEVTWGCRNCSVVKKENQELREKLKHSTDSPPATVGDVNPWAWMSEDQALL